MNKLTKQNVTANMLDKFKPFNKDGIAVDENTKHKDVLKVPLHQNLYKGAMYYTMVENGGQKAAFPGNWLDMTVDALADYIISKQKY